MRPQAQSITEFYRRPHPTEGVILGSGPSLDDYDPESANGAYVLALNAVGSTVPCSGVMYCDRPCNDLTYPDGVDIFRPMGRSCQHNGRGWGFAERRSTTPKSDAQRPPYCLLYFGGGIAGRAVSFFAMWAKYTLNPTGLPRLRFCGMDGMRDPPRAGTAKRVPFISKVVTPVEHYTRLGNNVKRALAYYGFEWSLD